MSGCTDTFLQQKPLDFYGPPIKLLYQASDIQVSQHQNVVVKKQAYLQIVEIALLTRLKHPNIIKVYDLIIDGLTSNIIMEYHSYSLRDYKKFSVRQLKLFLYQILEALAYLRKCRVLHNDIHAGNILVSNEKAVLTDFGISYQLYPNEQVHFTAQPELHRAPELFFQGQASFASDLWALAMTFYSFINPAYNFYRERVLDIIQFYHESEEHSDQSLFEILQPIVINGDYVPLLPILRNILIWNVDSRPDVQEILAATYFSDMDSDIDHNSDYDYFNSRIYSPFRPSQLNLHVRRKIFLQLVQEIVELFKDGAAKIYFQALQIFDIYNGVKNLVPEDYQKYLDAATLIAGAFDYLQPDEWDFVTAEIISARSEMLQELCGNVNFVTVYEILLQYSKPSIEQVEKLTVLMAGDAIFREDMRNIIKMVF